MNKLGNLIGDDNFTLKKKKKLSEVELKIKKHIPTEINYQFQRSVSYSQYSMWSSCPHKWYLSYVENLKPFDSTIYTVFGTAIHETLQHYIKTMYEANGATADRLDLEGYFQERFSEVYKTEYQKERVHFSDAEEMRNFYDDGIEILRWIKKRRNKIFTIRNVKLLGIELPLIYKLANNLYYKAYIDFALYDLDLNKVYIYDIKTSTSGWGTKAKKDQDKLAQILLYKEFFAKQYNIPVENVEVEFFIVKRKLYENVDWVIPRIQRFKPPSGKTKRKQAMIKFEKFIHECFNKSGKPIIKQYEKIVGESSCKYCPFRDRYDLCERPH